MLRLLTLVSLLASVVAAESYSKVFDLTLTWESYAPDGYEREMILVNGQFPGPSLDLYEGDYVQVNVYNELPFNTSLHFHGIEMLDTPWSDGVPGVTQRAIPPGSSFSYKWKATQHGSYWYHSHLRGQIEDGMYGPILIQPRKDRENPFSLISCGAKAILAMEEAERNAKSIVLSDNRHMTSAESWEIAVESNIEQTCYDSILVNGQGSVRCRSPEEIASLLTPEQTNILAQTGLNMTDKACLPAAVIGMGTGNPGLIPYGVFEGCKESEGGLAVIDFEVAAIEPEWNHCDDDKWIAFELIGTFGFVTARVSLDTLPMWVYAMDGEYIVPQEVNAITVTNGDRYSVLVRADVVGEFTLRVASVSAPQILSGYATVSIHDKKAPLIAPGDEQEIFILDNGAPTSTNVTIFDLTAASPYPPSPVAPSADALYHLTMRVVGSSVYWSLDGTLLLPFIQDAETPVLFTQPSEAAGRVDNVTIATNQGDWIDLVFETGDVPQPPHPIHRHGNKMYLIGMGDGHFEWASVDEAAAARPELFNLVDPPRKDAFATTQALQGPTWIVVRYHATNPGAWLLHCHIQNHLMGGMSMVILDGVDNWPHVPEEYLNYGA